MNKWNECKGGADCGVGQSQAPTIGGEERTAE